MKEKFECKKSINCSNNAAPLFCFGKMKNVREMVAHDGSYLQSENMVGHTS